jgi:hypothetical protein
LGEEFSRVYQTRNSKELKMAGFDIAVSLHFSYAGREPHDPEQYLQLEVRGYPSMGFPGNRRTYWSAGWKGSSAALSKLQCRLKDELENQLGRPSHGVDCSARDSFIWRVKKFSSENIGPLIDRLQEWKP